MSRQQPQVNAFLSAIDSAMSGRLFRAPRRILFHLEAFLFYRLDKHLRSTTYFCPPITDLLIRFSLAADIDNAEQGYGFRRAHHCDSSEDRLDK